MAALPILIRFSPEIALKANRARRRFEEAVIANLKTALKREGVPHTIERQHQRLLLHAAAQAPALAVLPRVFGIASYSPVEGNVEGSLEDVCTAAVALFADRLQGRTYAVRAKRTGRRVLSTRDLEIQVGAALNPFGKVDLTRPDITVRLEVQSGLVHFFTAWLPGAGGLPLGTQGKVATLISGGFDSAVAAWALMRRGAAMDFVFCNLGGAAYERMVLQVVKELCASWGFGMNPRLVVVDFQELVADLQAQIPPKFWQVVLKRLMVRTGCLVARQTGASAIVTGEALGQVSSQTLSNLAAIEAAAECPVLRPLIGFDKEEILFRARRIGTFHLSEHVREYCALTPRFPAVHSDPDRLAADESRLDPTLLEQAVAEARTIDVAALKPEDLSEPYLLTDEVPEGAVLIDCRAAGEEDLEGVGNVKRLPFEKLIEDFRPLEKDGRYVLFCRHGLRSALLAELLQKAGYEAYAFRGGLRAFKRSLERSSRVPDGDVQPLS